MRICQEWTR